MRFLIPLLCLAACTSQPVDSSTDAGDPAGASSSSSRSVITHSSSSAASSSVLSSSASRGSSSVQSSSSIVVSSSSIIASSSSSRVGSSSSRASSASSAAQCTPVTAAPDVDPWLMNQPAYGTGGVTTSNTGGHRDVFLDNPTHYTRIGVRLDWGGSVVFFGLAANPNSNVIDANDTGRELQLALYDPDRQMQGCAFDASCRTSSPCQGGITYLGWDPVQGGDECGHGSQATSRTLDDGLEVTVHPFQWNPDWNAMDCRQSSCPAQGVPVDVTYVMQFRFLTQHVVQLKLEVDSTETFDHQPTGQEFPTLYVAHGNPDLPVLLDASGTVVDITTPANDNFFVRNFDSPRPWVTWQNSTRDYGVGLAMDQGVTGFQGWRGDNPYFHNVRAVITFGLKSMRAVRGISYLALGGEQTVHDELEAVLHARAPFGVVDSPSSSGTAAGGSITVAGWVLDNAPVAQVEILVDGALHAAIPVNQARSDVCEVYPGYAGCPTAGFSGTVSTSSLTPCEHLMQVRAVDTDGNARVLGERVIRSM